MFRYLNLDHNEFSGDFSKQLEEFESLQKRTDASGLNVDHNKLSGKLPEVFYDLVYNAHGIGSLSAEGNNFRCAKGGDWPAWTFRTGSSFFGKCQPIATPQKATNVFPGELMSVTGVNFLASDELKCRLGTTVFPASFVSSTLITCVVPTTLTLGKDYELSVANYGSDFYSADTVASYTPLTVFVPHYSPSPPPPAPPMVPMAAAGLAPEELGGIVAGAGAALLCSLFLCYLVRKEVQGKPVFLPLDSIVGTEKTTTKAELAAQR